MRIIISVCLLLLLVLSGCSSTTNANPTAKSILKENPGSDILQFNGQIYINATNINDKDPKNYKKDQELGEIIKTTTSPRGFKDFYATKLPTGAKIFSTGDNNTYTLIVEHDGEEIIYTILLEG